MSVNLKSNGSVIVIQYGARRKYALAAVLKKLNVLEFFLTDLAFNYKSSEYLSKILFLFPRLVASIKRRTLPKALESSVHTFVSWTILLSIATRIKNASKRSIKMGKAHRFAGQRMSSQGYGNATHILSIFGEGRSYILGAKKKGLCICIDVNYPLSAEKILREAAIRNPSWAGDKHSLSIGSRQGPDTIDFILNVADKFFCPSSFIKKDLIENFNVDEKKIKLVPYAVEKSWFDLENKATIGEVVFVGNADFRKGIHTYAAAAKYLFQKGIKCNFNVIGDIDSVVKNHSDAQFLRFHDKLSHDKLKQFLSHSDIFCLPSLAEGSAMVIYEAMACGLPVITTAESGSIVEDGVNGFIIDSEDYLSLAAKVSFLIENRQVRTAFSCKAREQARKYDWDNYGDRLLEALFN
jgi:hypothetical protein